MTAQIIIEGIVIGFFREKEDAIKALQYVPNGFVKGAQ